MWGISKVIGGEHPCSFAEQLGSCSAWKPPGHAQDAARSSPGSRVGDTTQSQLLPRTNTARAAVGPAARASFPHAEGL